MNGGTPSSIHQAHRPRQVTLEGGTHTRTDAIGAPSDGTGTTGRTIDLGTIQETVIGVGETPTTDPSQTSACS